MKVIGMGELMVQLNSTNNGPLRYTRQFERHVAGSEANVIIGMKKLGIDGAFITAVGDDEFGITILNALRSEGIETNSVKTVKDFPTGVYFVQRGYPVPNKAVVFYYRRGSAFSTYSTTDLPEEAFADADLFHLSGITPALSESCKHASLKAVRLAKEHRVPVSFDTNIRRKLLPTSDCALTCLMEFIRQADFLITGQADIDFLFPGLSFEAQIEKMTSLTETTKWIVLKNGAAGASLFLDRQWFHVPGFQVDVVDELGAGDAFDAALLSSLLIGKDIKEALKWANAAGAMTVMGTGDIEPLPTWRDLEQFLSFYASDHEGLLR